MNRQTIYSLITWLVIIAIIVIFIFTIKTPETAGIEKKCPEAVLGNPNASLKITYIYSPSCGFCSMQTPILEKIMKEKGEFIYLEKYDYQICQEAVIKYKPTGTPFLVFTYNNTENSVAGYIDEQRLREILASFSID